MSKLLLLLPITTFALTVTDGTHTYTVDSIDDGIVTLSDEDTLEVRELELVGMDGMYLIVRNGKKVEFLRVED